MLNSSGAAARLKAGGLLIATSMMTAIPAHAEERSALPEVHVTAPSGTVQRRCAGGERSPGCINDAIAPDPQPCVDVPAGGERSLGCINQSLKRKVDQVNPQINVPPIDARSPDIKTGVVNIPGIAQQYGKNFGNSVIPYRPSQPSLGPTIAPRR
jgi:hypothetical protein